MGLIASLLTPRALIALLFMGAIAFTSLVSYKTGRALEAGVTTQLRLEHAKEREALAQAALADSETQRLRERATLKEANDVDKRYQVEKRLRVAADALVGDSLRRLAASIAAAKAGDGARNSASASGADDDPRLDIIAECAGAYRQMDAAARALGNQTRALQEYAAGVCVAKP